jgi:hypothetical protein
MAAWRALNDSRMDDARRAENTIPTPRFRSVGIMWLRGRALAESDIRWLSGFDPFVVYCPPGDRPVWF